MPAPYNFLHQYLLFNSGNEAPRNYHIWTSFILTAAAIHKRVYIPVGMLKVHLNIYVGLVGSQGSRKTTAKNVGLDLFTEAFPDYPILSSVQSREDIVRYMNEDCNKFTFTDHTGCDVSVRPIVGFINELMNFFSVDPTKSVQFFTDIYDEKRFKASTIKRGLEDLVNPCVNFLACSTAEWIIDNMKGNIISGGWARRIIYVYETDRQDPMPFPEYPENHVAMFKEMVDHLRRISQLAGVFEWDEDAKAFYSEWYIEMYKNPPADKMMAGFYESKHIQAIKLAGILALMAWPVVLRITKEHFQQAVAFLDVLEANMPKLFAAAGQNYLAAPQQYAIEALHKAGGAIPDKAFKKLLCRDLAPMEVEQLIRQMKDCEDLYFLDIRTSDGVMRRYAANREFYRGKTSPSIIEADGPKAPKALPSPGVPAQSTPPCPLPSTSLGVEHPSDPDPAQVGEAEDLSTDQSSS